MNRPGGGIPGILPAGTVIKDFQPREKAMAIKPEAELFKWGPIDGYPIYIDCFMNRIEENYREFPPGWPDVIAYFRGGKVTCIVDYPRLRKNGAELFRKHILDEGELRRNYSGWKEDVDALLSMMAEVDGEALDALSGAGLGKLFERWMEAYLQFWERGLLPELANWGGEEMLRKELLGINGEDIHILMERLTAPEDLSFFQKEELELLTIALEGADEKRLKAHQKKYFWLANSYGGAKVLSVDFFREEINSLPMEKIRAAAERIREFPAKTKEEKEGLIKKHGIPPDVSYMARKLAFCIWWQDLRKKYIFMANHYIKLFAEELSRRHSIPFEELQYYTVNQMFALAIDGKRADARGRMPGFVEHSNEGGGMDYLEGEEANEFIAPYLAVEVPEDVSEIRGMPTSLGTAKGKVRLVFGPDEVGRMEEGDVLVAPMTSPDFIMAMRKASAIVTDEGGLTCHAAIVSRELGIPCIVGTKIATKALKDGDEVEVDAEKGIVRTVKRA